jgi:hypothetical protein
MSYIEIPFQGVSMDETGDEAEAAIVLGPGPVGRFAVRRGKMLTRRINA